MFRVRVIPGAAALLVGLSLSACSGTSSNFDPLDWISADFLSTKTPLPGDRKPVFPEGVPGVPEGVPKEMIKGNQQAALEGAETPAPEATPAEKPAPKPKAAAKPAPKPRTASAPPQQSNQPAAAWPDANAPQAPSQRTTPNSAAQPNSQANWPPPDPNTFSR